MLEKLCFPYEYVDDFSKLEEKLPSIEHFHSKLANESISVENYEYIKQIWSIFDIQNLGHFSDLYMKVDILLLADAFEFFRKNSQEIYKLDPAHYVTLAAYSWDCMLRITRVKLKLLKDIEMYTFIESAKRGGFTSVIRRHALANNKYCSDYNPDKPSTYLLYIDSNNLYGET